MQLDLIDELQPSLFSYVSLPCIADVVWTGAGIVPTQPTMLCDRQDSV